MKQGISRKFTIAAALLLLSASGLNRAKGEKRSLVGSCLSTVEINLLQQNAGGQDLQDEEEILPPYGIISGLNLVFL